RLYFPHAPLWDVGSREAVRFDELKQLLSVPREAQLDWSAEANQPVCSLRGENFEINQGSSGGENWQSRNHVNREKRVPCSFRGYRVRHGEEESVGLRASPIVSVRGEQMAVTVAV